LYIPPHNRQEDPAKIAAFLRAHSFATLVTVGPDGAPRATHLPFLVEGEPGDGLRLVGHLAKANRQADDLASAGSTAALVIFQGPHAYVSPVHYEKPESVPTWNYVAVHAYGAVTILESDVAKRRVVDAMVRHYDPGYAARHEALPDEFLNAKLKGIVAFEMVVERVEARYKLSQDRTANERANVAAALRDEADGAAAETAVYMDRFGA
jgi:transcriptional regulator